MRTEQVPTPGQIQEASRKFVEQRCRLIRLPSVLDTVALSRSEWYRLISLGRAPESIPLGDRAVAWVESEVQAFVADRIAARDKRAEAGG